MIERTFDAGFVNAVANHPTVASLVRGLISGRLDLTPIIADHRNVVLVGEHGFAIFAYRATGVYEWHAAVLPEGYGQWALSAAREALDWLFSETDAFAVVAPVPENNRAARQITSALGFKLKETLPSRWPAPEGFVDYLIYVLMRREWGRCH